MFVQLSFSSPQAALNCQFDAQTKSYSLNEFSKGFPRKVIFNCGYNCTDLKGEFSFILGQHQVNVTSLESEALHTVCQGVRLKKNDWGYEIDKISHFYAHLAKSPEVKSWAVSKGRNLSDENRLRKDLILNLEEVIQGYQLASESNSPLRQSFKESVEALLAIQVELKKINFTLLDQWLELKIENFERASAGYLTLSVLATHAKWRQ